MPPSGAIELLFGSKGFCATNSDCPFVFLPNSRAPLKVSPCRPRSLHSLPRLHSPHSLHHLPHPASPPNSASLPSHRVARFLRSPKRQRGRRQEG